MLKKGFGRAEVLRQIRLAENLVNCAVANDVNPVGLFAAFEFGFPVVPVNARTLNHFSTAKRAGAERGRGLRHQMKRLPPLSERWHS